MSGVFSWLTGLVDQVLTLRGALAYGAVGGLAFAEAAVFLGFVVPGETAVILGGVLAFNGSVSLPLMLAVAVTAAIAGDSVGYEVGRRFGPRLLGTAVLARRRGALLSAERVLRTRGGPAVLLARFTAFLRAVTPGLAGTIGMPYRRFLVWNALGGTLWAAGFTLLGYIAGAGYTTIENVAGDVGVGVLVLAAALLVGLLLHRRHAGHRGRHVEAEEPSPGAGPVAAIADR